MYADSQVEGLVGNELLGLNFVLVSECQSVLAFVLSDELAYNGYISVLVFIIISLTFLPSTLEPNGIPVKLELLLVASAQDIHI